MSSSNESPKELEEVMKAPTNAKNKRKGKKTVEATSERGKRKKKSVVWDHFKEVEGDAYHDECIYCHQKISCASSNGTNAMKRHTSRCKKAPFNVDTKQTILDFESKTKCNADGTIETELRKVGGAPDDEDWDKIASFLPFLQIFYETTLSFSGSRHKLRYVEWIVRRSYDASDSYDLCHRIKSTLTSLFDFYASLHPSSTQTRSCSFNPYSSGLDGDGEIRKLKGTNLRNDYVTEIELNDTSETTTELVEALVCTQDWISASHDPIIIEENLLALENMEEEMQDLTLEQPTIIIDETNEVPE
ncbi:hypothetical protein V6N11_015610 [Hibiscus sabdariffa]|uniref:BED-type domain-containing protein n=1 Tax=Hibiscus sabdariffa TaxID=183260 RepID=A0ABR2TSL8_9ROSI